MTKQSMINDLLFVVKRVNNMDEKEFNERDSDCVNRYILGLQDLTFMLKSKIE